jgi:hypothetical protein
MNIIRDSRFRRRAIFVLVNAAICVVLLVVVVMPIHAFFVDRDSLIAEKKAVLARLLAIAAQEANVQSIESDTNAQMRGGEFLSGPNENVISADLQTRLKGMTESAGARSRAAQALPLKTSDQLKYIGSRVEIFGSLQSIQRAVYAIENTKPYLFVMGATLRMVPAMNRPGVAEEPNIEAQLDIFGVVEMGGLKP